MFPEVSLASFVVTLASGMEKKNCYHCGKESTIDLASINTD